MKNAEISRCGVCQGSKQASKEGRKGLAGCCLEEGASRSRSRKARKQAISAKDQVPSTKSTGGRSHRPSVNPRAFPNGPSETNPTVIMLIILRRSPYKAVILPLVLTKTATLITLFSLLTTHLSPLSSSLSSSLTSFELAPAAYWYPPSSSPLTRPTAGQRAR